MTSSIIVDMDELRSFGWRLWDPIGVDGHAPRDEYDSYLLGVVGILRNGGSDADAGAYLARVETEWLGNASVSPSARIALVTALRRYLERFPAGRLKFRFQ
ncbi:MAG TPA: hypothetical protein VIO94_15390 [Phenylobacterium sp.]